MCTLCVSSAFHTFLNIPGTHTITDADCTHFCAHGPHFVSICVWLFGMHGVDVGPVTTHIGYLFMVVVTNDL